MIVVTVFLSILNQMDFHLVQIRKENCHHDHIPFNVEGNGNIDFSVYSQKQQRWDVQLSERLASLGIRETQLRASTKPPYIIALSFNLEGNGNIVLSAVVSFCSHRLILKLLQANRHNLAASAKFMLQIRRAKRPRVWRLSGPSGTSWGPPGSHRTSKNHYLVLRDFRGTLNWSVNSDERCEALSESWWKIYSLANLGQKPLSPRLDKQHRSNI